MKRRLSYYLLILGMLLSPVSLLKAQNPVWQWIKSESTSFNESGRKVVSDAAGNSYISSVFSGSITVGPSTYNSFGGSDILLVKYDASGNRIWSRQFGSTLNDEVGSMVIDRTGHIYLQGTFLGPSFQYGSGSLTNTSSGFLEIYLLRIDQNGVVNWGFNPNGTGSDYTGSIYSDDTTLIMTGNFQSPVISFGPYTLSNISFRSMFLSRLDSSGNVLWVKQFGNGRIDAGYGLATDKKGAIYLAGSLGSNTLTFGTTTLTRAGAGGTYDLLLAKFDGNGNSIWAKAFGGTDSDEPTDLVSDSLGNLYVTGYFKSASMNFGGTVLASPGALEQTFVARYDSTGTLRWVRKTGNDIQSRPTDIHLIKDSAIMVAGYYSGGSLQFNTTLPNAGGFDGFTVQFDSTGTSVWSDRLGGSSDDKINGVYATVCGAIIVAESNSPSVTAGAITLTSSFAGTNDIIHARFARTLNYQLPADTLRINALSAVLDAGPAYATYLWNTGQKTQQITVDAVGRYLVRVISPEGCYGEDSVYVSLVYAQIFQQDTIICKGKPVLLEIDSSYAIGKFFYSTTKSMNASWSIATSTIPYARYRMVVSGNWSPGVWATDRLDAAFLYNSSTNTAIRKWVSPPDNPAPFLFNGQPIRPVTDVFRPDHIYDYQYLTPSGTQFTINFTEAVLVDNSGSLKFDFYTINNPVTVTWSTGQSGNAITVQPAVTTKYYVTLTDGITTSQDSVLVTVLDAPTPSLPDTLKICGDSVELDAGAGAASYLWSTGAATQKIMARSSGKYYVTAGNAIGCTSLDSVYVSFTKAEILQNDTTVCKNAPVVLNATIVSGASYSWSSGATGQTTTVTPLASTKYYLQVSNGIHHCTDSIQITVLDLPQPSLPDSVKYCGTSVQIDAGAGFSAYTWSTGASTQTITVSNSGKYYVDVTGSAVCSNRDSVYVSLVSAAIQEDDTVICKNASLTLHANTLPGYTYNWSTGATAASVQVHTSTPVKYYLLTSDGIQGCLDSIAVSVHQIDTTVSASGPAVFCIGQSVQLQAMPGYAYAWYRNNMLISGADAQQYVAISNGDYKVYVSNGFGCTDSSYARTVTVNALPQVNLNTAGPVAVCEGSSYTFSANIIPNAGGSLQYQWLQNGITLPGAVTATYSATTAGAYSLQVTNSNGCSQVSNATTFSFNAPPVAVFPNGTAIGICNGTAAQLEAQVSAGSGTISALQWYRNGVAVLGATTNPYSTLVSGTYTLKATNSNGCSSISVPVTVSVSALPVTTLIPPAVTKICRGVYTTLQATGGTTYNWYLNGQLITGATSATYDASEAGTYSVKAYNAAGCSAYASNTVLLAVIEVPQPDFTATVNCAGSASSFTNLTVTDPSDQVNYSWSMGDGTVYNTTNATHLFAKGGTYPVRLSATSTACPFAPVSTSQLVTVEQPRAGIRYDAVNAIAGRPQPLQARTFASQYSWSPANGLSNAFIAAPVATVTAPQTYTITLTTASGCVTVDTLLVRLFQEREIYVPTAFTPNGDGKNDRLYPLLVGMSNLSYFKVYNRWGNLVFETNSASPASGWDGQWKGVMQPMETYVWVAAGTDIDGKPLTRNGSVLLIR